MQPVPWGSTDPIVNVCQPRPSVVPHLQRSAVFRDYQRAFEITTGLPLMLRAVGAFQPPLHSSTRGNAFCAFMGTGATCSACVQFQQQIEQRSTSIPTTLECFAGLSESVVALRVGKNVVGYLHTGQVLLRKPSRARFHRALRRVNELGGAVDPQAAQDVYFRTPVIARRRYGSVLRLLAIFAEHLSTLSNQIMVHEAAASLPVVANARKFIAEHLQEKLSLTRVAAAVQMDAPEFCKVFRKQTGLGFVDYRARVRIERVKRHLLDPHARISEAAFAAGFQSLAQFNRVFRRIAGESPSEYRARLHNRATACQSRALVQAA